MEARSWFQGQGEAHTKDRSVIYNEDDAGGRAIKNDQRRRASAAMRLNSDYADMKVGWL